MFIITMPLAISSYASEIASFIAEQKENSFDILQESIALGFAGKGTYQQLDDVFAKYSSLGWDGERASPVSKEAVLCARIFLKSFPLGIEAPNVGADSDGAITLEWYRSPERVILISINPSGQLYFAAIIGAIRRHGTDFALFNVSEDLLGLISEVVRGAVV